MGSNDAVSFLKLREDKLPVSSSQPSPRAFLSGAAGVGKESYELSVELGLKNAVIKTLSVQTAQLQSQVQALLRDNRTLSSGDHIRKLEKVRKKTTKTREEAQTATAAALE